MGGAEVVTMQMAVLGGGIPLCLLVLDGGV